MNLKSFIKITALMLVICMLAGNAVFAEGTVRICGEQSINAAVGTEFEFPVYIKNNPGICKFTVSIAYDGEVIEPVADSEKAGDIAANIIANPSYMNKPDTRVAGIHPTNIDGDGILFTYKFRVKDTVNASTDMTVSVVKDSLLRLSDELNIEKLNCDSTVTKIIINPSEPTVTPTASPTSAPTAEPTAVPAAPSCDMKENAAQIRYMASHGDKFEPDTDATRYEVIEALYNLLDFKNLRESSKEFSDVDSAYGDMVKALNQTAIIDGYPDGTFGGEKSITRAEFVKVVSLAAGIAPNEAAPCDLSDITGHWAQPYVASFVSAGYIFGYPDGTFAPDNNISRAEVVAIINRVTGMEKSENAEKVFGDTDSTHWAYGDIMAAAIIPDEEKGSEK